MDRYSSNRFSGGTLPSGPSGRWALRRLVAIGAIAAVLAAGIAPTSAAAAKGPRIGPVRVFASVPAPGHPFGIAVDDGRVYVSTSAGDFFADPANGGHRNSDGERVFTYDAGGTLLDTTSIATMPDATWACWGSRSTATPDLATALYVADMNGRILRVDPGRPCRCARGLLPGPRGHGSRRRLDALDVERPGLRPGGQPLRARRQAADLAGRPGWHGLDLVHRSPARRLLRLRRGPARCPHRPVRPVALLLDHRVGGVPAGGARSTGSASSIIRPRPTSSSSIGSRSVPNADPPQATGRSRSRRRATSTSACSGRTRSRSSTRPGTRSGASPSPLFHSPWGLAFTGKSLLVANGDLEPGDNPDAWKIFKVSVGERGLPLNEPRLPAG